MAAWIMPVRPGLRRRRIETPAPPNPRNTIKRPAETDSEIGIEPERVSHRDEDAERGEGHGHETQGHAPDDGQNEHEKQGRQGKGNGADEQAAG